MKLGSKAFVSCFMGEGLSIFHRTELSMSYWFSCLQLSKFFLLCSNPNSHLRCLTWKPASCQIFLRHAYIFVNTSDHRAEYDAFFRRHALRHWILWTYKKSKHIDLRGRPCSAFESCCWFSQANSSALRNAIKSTGRTNDFGSTNDIMTPADNPQKPETQFLSQSLE